MFPLQTYFISIIANFLFHAISATELKKKQIEMYFKVIWRARFWVYAFFHQNKPPIEVNLSFRITKFQVSSDCGLWSRRSGLSDPEVKNLTLTGNLVDFCVSINVSPYKKTLLAYLKKIFFTPSGLQNFLKKFLIYFKVI